MKFDELKEMIETDSKLDISKLDKDALHVPYLQGKYINKHSVENGKLKRLELELKKLKFKKYQYYSGKATGAEYQAKPLDHTILKTDVQRYIDGDAEIFELENRILTQKMKVDAISEFVKALGQRTYLIKSAIDYLKFTNGV